MSDENVTNGRISLDWMEAANQIANLVLLNMLWLLCSILIVTIPVATVALFAVLAPWARGQPPAYPFGVFFRAIRRYWWKATAVGLIDLLLGGLLYFNFLILPQMDNQFIVLPIFVTTTIMSTILISSNIYLWPLLVTLDPPFKSLLKNSVRLGIAHAFWAVAVALMAVAPIVLALFVSQIFFFIITISATVFIISWGAWRIIQRYLNEAEREELGID